MELCEWEWGVERIEEQKKTKKGRDFFRRRFDPPPRQEILATPLDLDPPLIRCIIVHHII